MTFEPMVKRISAGQSGKAEVQHFHVGEKEYSFMILRQMVTRGREVPTPVGDYCRLLVNGEVVMSDTYLEETTNTEVVSQARGHVLIAGLGLGYILVPILRKEGVKSVTVIEKHQDVINLVGPQFKDRRLSIILGDIFTWKPENGSSYDVIYFDIWPTICSTNLNDMARLERRFRPFKNENGWMGSWAKVLCKRQR